MQKTIFFKVKTALTGIIIATSFSAHSQTDKSSSNEIEELTVMGKSATDLSIQQEDTKQLFSIAGAAMDPLQAIYALPGIALSEDGEPVIRGSAPQDNSYYTDLIPMQYLFHVFGNSIFDKNLIHSFELHPAAFSSQYANATGGVIDVRLRDPKTIPLTTTLTASFLQSGVMFEGAITENQSFYLSYRRSVIDQFLNGDDAEEEDDGIRFEDLPVADDYQFKYLWQLNDSNRLSVIAAGAGDFLDAELEENSNFVLRDPDLQGAVNIDQGFDSQGIIWEWSQPDANQTFDLRLTHMKEISEIDYGIDLFEKIATNKYTARMDYSHQLSTNHRITTGISHEDSSHDIDIYTKLVICSDFDPDCPTINAEFLSYKDKVSIKVNNVYLEDSMQLGLNQTLNIGLHYAKDDYLNESSLEPRLRWNYQINDNIQTHIALGQYSQLPELSDMLEEVGNPELERIKANHFVWGLEQQLNNEWNWQVDLYYKDMNNVVISGITSDAVDAERNYTNNAEGIAYGAEFILNKHQGNDKWSGWVAISLGKAERTDLSTGTVKPFSYDKPIMIDLVANYQLSERWSLAAKWSYESGDMYTPVTHLSPNINNPDILEPIYGEYNSERFSAYHRLDLRAEYLRNKSWGHWTFYIDLLNAYNRENINAYDYSPNNVDTLDETPAGFGEDVPVTAEVSMEFFPSLGFEIRF